jgi:DNA-binding protein Fis
MDEDLSLDAAIKRHIEKVLELTGSHQTRAAKALGIPLSTLRNKMKKVGARVRKD